MSKPLYDVEMTSVFKKELKKAKKRGLDLQLLNEIVTKLQCGEPLPDKNKDHALTGNWVHHRECHIQPDWLLIYQINDNELYLVRTGTHADLFGL